MKLILRSFSSLPLVHSRRVVVSYKRKYVHELLVNRLWKSVVRWTGRPAMTIAVDLGRKATKQTNKTNIFLRWVWTVTYIRCVTGLNKEKNRNGWVFIFIYLIIYSYFFFIFLLFVDCVCSLESHINIWFAPPTPPPTPHKKKKKETGQIS